MGDCDSPVVNDPIIAGKICPYCLRSTAYIDSSFVYGKSFGKIYHCRKCRAYVGVHKGTDKALGSLANQELRVWRRKAHKLFDGLWQKKMSSGYSKKVARRTAYLWLSGQMKTEFERTHIAMFDVDQCKKVVELCSKYYKRK
jgi:hypothetical protein